MYLLETIHPLQLHLPLHLVRRTPKNGRNQPVGHHGPAKSRQFPRRRSNNIVQLRFPLVALSHEFHVMNWSNHDQLADADADAARY